MLADDKTYEDLHISYHIGNMYNRTKHYMGKPININLLDPRIRKFISKIIIMNNDKVYIRTFDSTPDLFFISIPVTNKVIGKMANLFQVKLIK